MPPPGVKARIDRFWRASRRLQTLTSIEIEEFIKDEDAVDAAERNLHVAVEAIIDVGEALISFMKWRIPKSYRDVAVILNENGVLDEEMTKIFQRIVALRNILVHNYVYITSKDLYISIKNIEEFLIRIMNQLIEYMNERGIDP